MTVIATQRLIEASADLGPYDRALLSLMVNHGLDDEALAHLMHTSSDEVAVRREQLEVRLSAELGLPADMVRGALTELRGAAGEHRSANDQPVADRLDTDSVAAAGALPSPPATPPERQPALTRVRRRNAVLALLGLAVAAVIVLVIALSSSGGSRDRPPASVPARSALIGLPGVPAGVTGTLALTGPRAHPRLIATVSRLPPAGGGHYELWLYNTIIDAVPIARLGAPGGSVAVQLPSGYRRYRWLDVSYQPPGSVNHSGESILRAAVFR